MVEQKKIIVYKRGKSAYIIDINMYRLVRNYKNITTLKEVINKQIYLNSEELELIKKCTSLFYQTEIIITNIPENIKKIAFCPKFNQNIFEYLHPNIICLLFGKEFNQPVDLMPEQLTILQFGQKFNFPVNNLPSKLKHIQFGELFNQSVDMLPESLEVLIFGASFNQDISNLPNSLKSIRLGRDFSFPINSLPESVNTVVFAVSNTNFSHNILKLPTSLKNIKLPWIYFGRIKAQIPESLEQIIISNRYTFDNKISDLNKLAREFKIDINKIIITNYYN